MTQYIVSGNEGVSYVMRNGMLVPQKYRKCELGGGWVHWMTNTGWNSAYRQLEEAHAFTCEHPDHRNYAVHSAQAATLRDLPAYGRG